MTEKKCEAAAKVALAPKEVDTEAFIDAMEDLSSFIVIDSDVYGRRGYEFPSVVTNVIRLDCIDVIQVGSSVESPKSTDVNIYLQSEQLHFSGLQWNVAAILKDLATALCDG
jgi:hypothetical protein